VAGGAAGLIARDPGHRGPEVTDHEALEIALVENLQREDLSPIEEAEGYRRLIEMCGCSQQDLAKIIGKTESYVSHSMRLLKLPEPVRRRLEAGELSARHGRLINSASCAWRSCVISSSSVHITARGSSSPLIQRRIVLRLTASQSASSDCQLRPKSAGPTDLINSAEVIARTFT